VGSLPKISIVTPSYNQGQYIDETIKSVLAQDYPNIEYIVVDGASTDNTVEILKGYGKRIRWISEKDNGQTEAIKKGFELSTGEFIAWLNSDDLYLPGAVSRVMDFFKNHPGAAMVYGKSYYIDEHGTRVGEYPTGPVDTKRLPEFNFICQPSAFFTREAFVSAGALDEGLHYSMDYDLWLRMSKKYELDYIEDYLSLYRLHAESKTVAEHHQIKQTRETLDLTLKYFNRAPANRVYMYCLLTLRKYLPFSLGHLALVSVPLALLWTLVKYLTLNRGINGEDLRLLNLSNLKKILFGP
jgi:glycosyltransferase involved in cell wall biosynthesis